MISNVLYFFKDSLRNVSWLLFYSLMSLQFFRKHIIDEASIFFQIGPFQITFEENVIKNRIPVRAIWFSFVRMFLNDTFFSWCVVKRSWIAIWLWVEKFLQVLSKWQLDRLTILLVHYFSRVGVSARNWVSVFGVITDLPLLQYCMRFMKQTYALKLKCLLR